MKPPDDEGTAAIITALLGLIGIIAFISFCAWLSNHIRL